MISDSYLFPLIERAFAEDIGDGDHTSLSCIPQDNKAEAVLLVKEDGIIAGVDVAKKVVHYYSPKLNLETFIDDGVKVSNGDVVFKLSGPQRDILAVERTILNFMQRMSGIATHTNQYVQKLQGLKTKVLDTRKTTPGLRLIEKEAVKIGGGENHRIGLYDMIMIKDNHIDYAGGIRNAIIAANKYIIKNNLNLKIEIEVRNLDELRQVLEIGKVHRIMLDNFDIPATKKAVDMIGGKYETESSGGITLDTIRQYAECGVDYVSVGALTHHIKSLDLSLKAVKK
ncbi:MAG: carboxylating nicotinate-nucleotide diphosphorylase [Bacteroidales bacterium]|jgi:nicotinate-nucleotide pyrophosphorylase (carboxylating)|nr:carboxylating nicotinate-nucleotide diphosphorylase [Bacteroidales bacterium]HOL99089.1 carboxylating nicotinate-nucleotide diphosphorylase [Bacteroidales bacterium]HOM37329.1 carboxylating nicotinate-nucleotide diphosphorylase [Bacteroidales bacterium]HPD24883.1 carboxylating nicotinate-nucleotide diphosphorylase [Bacteroidales bacterium]HRT00594.1 carboxylating nicotinate-nucleotide diphosphorylase [Bacteroidales bacterium]